MSYAKVHNIIYNGFNWYLEKAYSSVVERTAHNGFVTGSSPVKLKIKQIYAYITKKFKNNTNDKYFENEKCYISFWYKYYIKKNCQ